MLRLQRTVGNRATATLVKRAGLTIGRDGDPLERQADAQAALILRAMRSGPGSAAAARGPANTVDTVHRKGATHDPLGGQPVQPEVEAAIDRARGGGRAVAPPLRLAAERVLGADLSRVRVHDDSRADALSRSLQSRAFATGRDIFLRRSGFTPSSLAGHELLAHEITHVAQQGGTIRRRLVLDKTKLPGASDNNETMYRKQVDLTYGFYERVADKDPKAEMTQLTKLAASLKAWADHNPSNQANEEQHRAKKQMIVELRTQVTVELEKVKGRLAREGTRAIGLPDELIGELLETDRQALVSADAALNRGDVAEADRLLLQLRATIDDGTLGLLRSMLMHKNLATVNPELAATLQPGFELRDPTAIKTATATLQQYGTDRANELAKQAEDYNKNQRTMDEKTRSKAGVQVLEGKMQGPVLKNLLGGGSNLKQGYLPGGRDSGSVLPARQQALHGLTAPEISAILGYTTNLYGKFNTPLRGTMVTPPKRHRNVQDVGLSGARQAQGDVKWAKGASNLSSAELSVTQLAVSGLNKLKPYTDLAYRHGSNFGGYEKLNRTGATVVDMGFMSSAATHKGSDSGGQDHEVIEVIRSKTGRDVSMISAFGVGEGEVLFFPATRFRVTRVARRDPRTSSWPPNDPETEKYLNETSHKKEIQLVVYKEEV